MSKNAVTIQQTLAQILTMHSIPDIIPKPSMVVLKVCNAFQQNQSCAHSRHAALLHNAL
jgi:hypothetical protein